MLIKESVPKFTELNELCGKNIGGKISFATDDFFATAENMLQESEPIFIVDKYTEYGKWMDGWETRRKRIGGHDWCIVKLATKAVVKGIQIDTAYFTGNYAPKFSIQAANLTNQEENVMPGRVSEMGSSCSRYDMDQIAKLKSEDWKEIVPMTSLRPGYEETRRNYQKVLSDESWTHIRLNIYPDGGIARLRVYGIAQPDLTLVTGQMYDLVSMMHGGICQGFSNAHYGHPRNMIKPSRGVNMGDGWETARRLDRPNIIKVNGNGTLLVDGEEWAVFKLCHVGKISHVCIDTNHFKGNYPDSVKIEGACLDSDTWSEDSKAQWFTLMPANKLSAHKEHWFDINSDKCVTHVRLTIAPDGGISRLRVFGKIVL